MNRKEITNFLNALLEREKLSGVGKYSAKEVSFDWGTPNAIRVDYMQFVPKNQLSISGLEKGIFICYEVKSCKEDFLSGHGKNFIGEKNYLVMTVQTYKELKDLGEIDKLPYSIGILCPICKSFKYKDDKIEKQLASNKQFDDLNDWYFETVKSAREVNRKRSIVEILFSMMRSINRDH